MARRLRGSPLERWEVALVKALLARGGTSDQDVLAYFTRPTRSVNHRVISDIREARKSASIKPAPESDVEAFLAAWPDVDPQTGLSVRGDELLIKAQEAMVAAVHTFNGAGLTFRTELFIVTAVIAWTYLMHAYYARERVDYRHREASGGVLTTRQGAERFWELGRCLRANECPLDAPVTNNLEFIIELRHEIEHRSTSRIDDTVSAKLQACCINFNDAIKRLFGPRFSLERRLPIALQFVTFGSDQRALLKRARDLPSNVEAMMEAFHGGMTPEQQSDPAFAYRVAFIAKLSSRASNSDEVIEFIRSGSEEGQDITRILLKDVDRKRYTGAQVVKLMQDEGYPSFTQQRHTELWQSLGARAPNKGFGKSGLYKGSWEWFEQWVARVRAHCQENSGRYCVSRPEKHR